MLWRVRRSCQIKSLCGAGQLERAPLRNMHKPCMNKPDRRSPLPIEQTELVQRKASRCMALVALGSLLLLLPGAQAQHIPGYNYDEARIAPYTLLDPLRTDSGSSVTTAQQWWNIRRPEIARLFEENVSVAHRLRRPTPPCTPACWNAMIMHWMASRCGSR